MNVMSRTFVRKFKIGYYFDLYSFSDQAWREEAEINMALKPEHMEIMLECPGSCTKFGEREATYLQSILPGMPLSAHAPTLNHSLVAMGDLLLQASIDEHLISLDSAHHLGAKLFTLHAGPAPFHACMDGNSPLQVFKESIKPILAKAEGLGIQVLVENLGGGLDFPSTFKDTDETLSLSPSLMLALDTRHFCKANLDPIEGYHRYKDRVSTIQFRMDGRMSEEQIKEFLIALLENQYDGVFIIEDKALTSLHKTNRSQITAGRECVYRLLNELGAVEFYADT